MVGATATATISASQQTLNSLESAINNDLPMRVNNMINNMLVSFNTESSLFDVAKQTLLSQFDLRVQSSLNGLLADQADRYALQTEDSTYIYGLNQTIAASVSAYSSTEVSRGVSAYGMLNQAASEYSTVVSNNLTASINAEIYRVTGTQSAAAATIIFRVNTSAGSTDLQSW